MNPFEDMQNDVIHVEDQNSVRSGPYKTAITAQNGRHTATLFDVEIGVEEGCKIFQSIPGGREQAFTVLETNYSPEFHGIPAHWSLVLRKEGSLAHRPQPVSQTINISHSTGVQVGDHNVQHIVNSLVGLAESINAAKVHEEEKAEAKGLFREFITNPIVASVLGSAASGIVGLLS